ncbi:hypothetical protein IZ6_02710 [Terrihabitans soli]|uniref:Autotransporter domain-containing protein n=1 Tax=Terrihabitans soli TaxID=708113 RepID=A0A6S6QJX8_9HYPH|nr:autotransporter outer membrane beta-barrel domain-containing protein [Terrihabitans soli]BCJ89536.1 hypothetical protein IZ6_02710 [Terrihabitans soli]
MVRFGAVSGRQGQLRALLLGSVAAGVFGLTAPAVAEPDACVIVANVATCSGNQSGGVREAEFPNTTDTLIIENVTSDIGSTGNDNGVRWAPGNLGNTGPFNVISDTGEFAIRAQSSGFSLANVDGQNVSLDHTGNIFAGARGVEASSRGFIANATSAGDVSVAVEGNIVSEGIGISALSQFDDGDGDSGDAIVTFFGDIVTEGDDAISALSIANHNGDSGDAIITSVGIIGGGIFASSGVAGDGNAGDAQIQFSGRLTQGSIVARSVVLGAGNAGAVELSAFGDIQQGGLSAESVAIDGIASAVSVEADVDIATVGTAIVARSLGTTGQGDIDVAISGGRVNGASTGVAIEGGAANSLSIDTDATLLSAGTAIFGGTGDERIFNEGRVQGNVDLGAGLNDFNNGLSGVFNTGTVIDLGAAGFLNNGGFVSIGGSNSVPVTAELTGGYVQDGFLRVDIAGGTSDRLNVSGSATLDGFVNATVHGLISQTQQFTILSAVGGITDNGIGIEDTFVFDFDLFVNGNDLILEVSADFTPADAILTPNQQAVADHLDDALTAGGGNLGAVFAHLGNQPDAASFAAALDRLHPEPYLAQTQSLLFANLNFADGLMSCPVKGETAVSKYLSEGECGWIRYNARRIEADRTAENIGIEEDVWGGSAGAQKEIAPGRFISFAAGYDKIDQTVDDRAWADGDVFHAGVGAKFVRGSWQLSAAISGGYAQYDTTRFDVLPGVNAEGDARYGFASARLRAAYLFERESFYVKPLVDMDATGIHRSSFHEEGAGGAGLDVEGGTDILVSLAPAVEIGGEYAVGGNTVRPFLRAGVRAFSEDELSVSATFYSLPQLEPLTVTTPLDQVMGQVSAGLDLVRDERFDARVSYDGMFGDRTVQHAGNVKLRVKF